MRAENSGLQWNIPLLNDMPNVSLFPISPWIVIKTKINFDLMIRINKDSLKQVLKTISDLTIPAKYNEHLTIHNLH